MKKSVQKPVDPETRLWRAKRRMSAAIRNHYAIVAEEKFQELFAHEREKFWAAERNGETYEISVDGIVKDLENS